MAGTALLDVDLTPTTITTSGQTTTVYAFTVPGGTLGTTNALRLHLNLAYDAPFSLQRNWELRALYNQTVLFSGTLTIPDVVPENAARFDLFVAPQQDSLVAQYTSAYAWRTWTDPGTTSGYAGATPGTSAAAHRWVTEDSTSALPLFVTIRPSNDDITVRMLTAHL